MAIACSSLLVVEYGVTWRTFQLQAQKTKTIYPKEFLIFFQKLSYISAQMLTNRKNFYTLLYSGKDAGKV